MLWYLSSHHSGPFRYAAYIDACWDLLVFDASCTLSTVFWCCALDDWKVLGKLGWLNKRKLKVVVRVENREVMCIVLAILPIMKYSCQSSHLFLCDLISSELNALWFVAAMMNWVASWQMSQFTSHSAFSPGAMNDMKAYLMLWSVHYYSLLCAPLLVIVSEHVGSA